MKVSVIFGTRPEAVKMAPVIAELKKHSGVKLDVCVTAQHRKMLDETLAAFGIAPDTDLDLMQPGQSLAQVFLQGAIALGIYITAK